MNIENIQFALSENSLRAYFFVIRILVIKIMFLSKDFFCDQHILFFAIFVVSNEKRAVIESAVNGLNSILSCHSPFEHRDPQKHGNLHYLRFFSGQG